MSDGPGDDEMYNNMNPPGTSSSSSLFGHYGPPPVLDEDPSGSRDPPPYVHCVRPKEPAPKTEQRKKTKKKKAGITHQDDQPSPSRQLDSVLRTVRSLGYSDEEISIASQRIEESGEELSYSSLIDAAYTVQNEQVEKSVLEQVATAAAASSQHAGEAEPESDTAEGREESENSDQNDNDDETEKEINFETLFSQALEKRKRELRDAIDQLMYICKVCQSSPATVLLLPCGHLVSCESCLMDVRRCPVSRCNKVVRGTKDVYFV